MTEQQIRKKFIEICKKKNWIWYYPPKTRWQHEDMLGIGDILICRNGKLILIQITTAPNVSARRKKIKEVLETHNFTCPIEIWSYNKKKKEFKRSEAF